MDFGTIVVYIATLFFIGSIAKMYWSWRNSVSGIALGTATMVLTIFVMILFIVKVDIVNLVISILSGDDIYRALEKSKPTVIVSVINVIISIIFASIILSLGYFGIKNYKGPVKSSELDVKKEDDQNMALYVRSLIISDLKYLIKPNSVIYQEGRNPYKIIPLSKPKSWNEVALDLLKSSNKDISSKSVPWSDSDKCYILEKTDFIKNTSKQVYLFPLLGNQVNEVNIKTIDRIYNDISVGSEIILCFEDATNEPTEQTTKNGSPFIVTDKITLIEKSTDLSSYAKSILERFQKNIVLRYPESENEKGTSWNELTLEDTYTKLRVSSYCTENSHHEAHLYLDELINNWLNQKASPQLSILGQFGQGKSTAMLHFAAIWAMKYLKSRSDLSGTVLSKRERVPLLIELRGRSPKDQPTGIGILGEWGHQYGLSGEQLNNLVNSKMAILIFEGFDEVKNAGRKLDRYEHFNALWKFAFKGSKIIFTGRPNFFLDDEERVQFLNSHSDVLSNGSSISSAYSIEFMSTEDINNTLRNVREKLKDEIVSHSVKDPLFMDIAKRPSMLPVVVSQWENIKTSQQTGEKLTSSQIVRSYIVATYKRKDEEVRDRGEYQLLPWEIRHFITQALCLDMIYRNDKNTTTPDNIERVVRKVEPFFNSVYLSKESPPHLVAAITKLNHEKISKDKSYDDYISEISSDVRSNGLLVPDPASGTKSLYFPHKQFYEYILGETYASFYKVPKSQAAIALSKSQGRRYVSLVKACYSEPMSIQYFSDLFSVDQIIKLNPGLDHKKYTKLIKPLYIFVCNLLQMFVVEIESQMEASRVVIKESLVSTHTNTSSRVFTGLIIVNKQVLSFFLNPRLVISGLVLYLLSPSVLFFMFFFQTSLMANMKVKYALMRLRCQKKDIELIFKNEKVRNFHESSFRRMYQETEDGK